MLPNVTTISGTVEDAAAAAVAGRDGGDRRHDVQHVHQLDGDFTFTNAAGFGSGTVVASQLGTGRMRRSGDITPTSPLEAPSHSATSHWPRANVTVVFTLNTAGSVTFGGTTTPTTGTPPTATFTDAILENATGRGARVLGVGERIRDARPGRSRSVRPPATRSLSIAQPVTLVAS